MRRALRALPTLVRVGFAEAVAYRAEMLVWLLSTTMPLVMLALMTAVAREGPVGKEAGAISLGHGPEAAAAVVDVLEEIGVL